MGQWVPYPRAFPAECFRCGGTDPGRGPYLEVDAPPNYIVPRTNTKGRQYWCKECFSTEVHQEGSPFKQIVEEAVQRETEILKQEIAALQRKAEPVTAMVDEIRRQLGRDRQQQHQRQAQKQAVKK